MQDNSKTKGDFPNTYREFVQEFPGDEACAVYLSGCGGQRASAALLVTQLGRLGVRRGTVLSVLRVATRHP
jgi:hypothetical protein